MSPKWTEADTRSPISRFGLWFFGFLLIAIAPVAGYFTVMRVLDARASSEWPTVSGTVMDSKVEERPGGKKPQYAPVVRYRYQVNGRDFTGTEISHFSSSFDSRNDAQALVNAYPVNAKVTVYHRPDMPEEAVLRPGMDPLQYLLLLIPVVMLVIGGACLFAAWTFAKQAKAMAATGNSA